MDGLQQVAPDRAAVQPGVPARTRPIRLRSILLVLLGLAAGSAAGYYGHRWWTTGRFVEETDDAYTQADAVTIAPRVSGTISSLVVTDNQLVSAGQVLARIDDRLALPGVRPAPLPARQLHFVPGVLGPVRYGHQF
jgi:membrane fusion protein, multidrug efflux system